MCHVFGPQGCGGLQVCSCTFYVHMVACTSEEAVFQPSDSAHKVEPKRYNVTLLPFNHLFDRPKHSVVMVTRSSETEPETELLWYLNCDF